MRSDKNRSLYPLNNETVRRRKYARSNLTGKKINFHKEQGFEGIIGQALQGYGWWGVLGYKTR